MGGFVDLTGKKFGNLTVVSMEPKRALKHIVWLCKCLCGNTKKIAGYHLTQGKTKSCGCLQGGVGVSRNKKHGMSKTHEYNSWSNMMKRCYMEFRHDFKYYGGRGIQVCKRWHKFENFYEDMGPSNGLTIDRINVDGDYKPSNCRWATRKQQSQNRRKQVPNLKEVT